MEHGRQSIGDFLVQQRPAIIETWRRRAQERLGIAIEKSELLNDLPHFLDELAEALAASGEKWPEMHGARSHGRQRFRIGMDPGGLSEEMVLVGEVLIDIAAAKGIVFSTEQIGTLFHSLGKGVSASIRAYATLRDAQLAEQAAEHFSFIAHEVRTPLHTAQLTVGLLEGATDETKRARYVERLDRALSQVSELIDNSIIHARLQSRRIVPSRIDARELAERARDDVEHLALFRGQRISVDAETLELKIDVKLLCSALTNMLRNAVKFSCPNSAIMLRISERDGRALFEVEDSCGGIPEAVLPRLFQPFVQESEDKSGFGLGLLIVKEAAEAHHGAVRIANRPKEGCTFIMDIPLELEPTPRDAQ